MTLLIGVHPNNLHLALAARWPKAFDGLGVTFVDYPEGRDTAKLLAAGTIDTGGTGSTPPIFAQAAGLDVVYLAASAPRPANGGLVTKPGSAIRTIADLAGRRVALIDGSFHTYLLARVLESAGLSLRDVVRVELAPGASLHALEAGTVDAWVAMAPLLDGSLAAGRTQLLAPCGATIPNRSVFWTLSRRLLSERTIADVVAALVAFGDSVSADPDRAADLLADARLAHADRPAWRQAVGARDWHIVPASADILAEQQQEADTLLAHGDLAHAVAIAGPSPAIATAAA